jgi:hypothetical protein
LHTSPDHAAKRGDDMMTAWVSTPVIENCEPNCRYGSNAVVRPRPGNDGSFRPDMVGPEQAGMILAPGFVISILAWLPPQTIGKHVVGGP